MNIDLNHQKKYMGKYQKKTYFKNMLKVSNFKQPNLN